MFHASTGKKHTNVGWDNGGKIGKITNESSKKTKIYAF